MTKDTLHMSRKEREAARKPADDLEKLFREGQVFGNAAYAASEHRTPPAPTETSTAISDDTNNRHRIDVRGLDASGPVIEKTLEDLTDEERAAIERSGAEGVRRKGLRGVVR